MNISLDSQPGLSYSFGSSYSTPTPWPPSYYDWGYQPFFPSPHAYTASFNQHSSSANPEAAPATGLPPMAEDNSPFNLHFISGNISKCAGCGNKYVKPALPPYDLCVQHRVEVLLSRWNAAVKIFIRILSPKHPTHQEKLAIILSSPSVDHI